MSISALISQALNESWALLALAVGIWLLWKVPTWKASIEYRLTAVEKSMDEVKQSVANSDRKIDAIYDFLLRRFGTDIEKSTSPISLTDYGEELARKANAEKIVDRYADRMLRETAGMNTYQTQEHCFAFTKDLLPGELEADDKATFDAMTDVAYTDGIPLEKITRVIGISLRDRVLSMRDKPYPMETSDSLAAAGAVGEPANEGGAAGN